MDRERSNPDKLTEPAFEPSGGTAPCENASVNKYAVMIHREPEGGFWAEAPALPGCYSQGETVDELMENVREAISGGLDVMKANGTKPEATIQVPDMAV